MLDGPHVVLHHDVGEVDGLVEAWTKLAASRDQPLFFQSPSWTRQVAETRGRRASGRWRMCLASAWRGNRLTALWPLSLRREGLCWIARCLDDPFGQFAGFLAADDDDVERTIDAMIDALQAEGVAAGLMIERVAAGTPLHRCLTARGAKIGFSDRCAYIDFRAFEDFQSYLKTRKSKTRKNLRNARNRLERDHAVTHHVVTSGDDMRAVMAEAFEARLDWMKEQAKTAPAFRDPDFRHLLDGLLDGATREHLIGFRLRAGDTPISVQWGFRHAGRYYAFISARNPAFDAYSPGRLHLGMILQACFELGIEVVELMAPASDYKLNWTDETRRIDDFALAFTARGSLYLDLWRHHGRSTARRLYHGLPDGLRRHVAGFTNKNRAS